MADEVEIKEPKEEKKKSRNLLIIAAVLILIFAGAYYFYTNNVQSKADVVKDAVKENVEDATNDNSASDNSVTDLTSKKWTWVESQMSNDITTTPSEDGAFTASFNPDGTLALTTDCNNGSSSYEVGENNSLSISPIASTMMFCEGSAETAYFKQIQTSQSYKIENNQLYIMLQGDTGTMVFE